MQVLGHKVVLLRGFYSQHVSLCQEEAQTQQPRERWIPEEYQSPPSPHPQLTHALADLLRLLHVVHIGLGGPDAEGVTLVLVLHPL